MVIRVSRALSRSKSVGLAGLLALPAPVVRRLAGSPVVIDGKTLDPEMQLVLRLLALDGPPIESLPVSKGRRSMRASARVSGGRQPIGSVSDRTIDGPGGDLTLRFYTPRGVTGIAPALVFVHGGGWVYGDLETHDALCRLLAEEAQVRVVAVEYRLAPEHPFPAAIEDVRAAWDWVVENAGAVGIDRNRIAVGGDSAGGNLAIVLSQALVRDGGRVPDFQFLIYPATDFSMRRASRDLFGEGFFLTEGFMERCEDLYLIGADDRADPLASPLLGDVAGQPPAYVLTAGFDPLLDEGAAYADRLREAGVRVEYVEAPGLIHGFANMIGAGSSAPKVMRRAAVALQRGLS